MKNKNVIAVNPTSHYDLIDFKYLSRYGINVIPVVREGGKNPYHNALIVKNFSREELKNAIKNCRADFICCMNDRLSADIGFIREFYNIQGLNEITAKNQINKNVTYEHLKKFIRTPKTIPLNKNDTYLYLTDYFKNPMFFIKPHSLSASEGTCEISNFREFDNFVQNLDLNFDDFIVQEYLTGELYHCELIIQFGIVKYSNTRKYSSPNHKMITNNLPLLSTEIDDNAIKKIITELSIQIQRLLKVENAVMHIEFFRDNNDFIFLEANFRQPGIGLNKLYKRKLGISFETLMIMLEANIEIEKIISDDLFYLCGYYPIIAGTITKIDIPRCSINLEFETHVSVGMHYSAPKKLSKAASFLGWSENLGSIHLEYSNLLNHQLIIVSEHS
ncbi:MAG: ATP-grasp domain-containing protein [Legionellales bacterium]|nr:ATP-grasp domain-containing protein [Legionellales bacterium]